MQPHFDPTRRQKFGREGVLQSLSKQNYLVVMAMPEYPQVGYLIHEFSAP